MKQLIQDLFSDFLMGCAMLAVAATLVGIGFGCNYIIRKCPLLGVPPAVIIFLTFMGYVARNHDARSR